MLGSLEALSDGEATLVRAEAQLEVSRSRYGRSTLITVRVLQPILILILHPHRRRFARSSRRCVKA